MAQIFWCLIYQKFKSDTDVYENLRDLEAESWKFPESASNFRGDQRFFLNETEGLCPREQTSRRARESRLPVSTVVAFARYDLVGPSGHVPVAVVVTPKDLFVLLDGELDRLRISWTELRRRVGRSGKALLRHRSRACPNPSAETFFAALNQAGLSLSGFQSHVEFCELLDRRREELGLTSRQVARRVGAIASTTAWRALTGVTIPRLRTLLILASALGVTVELHLRRRDTTKPAAHGEHDPVPAPRGDFLNALVSFIPLGQRFAADEGDHGSDRTVKTSRARDGPAAPALVTR